MAGAFRPRYIQDTELAYYGLPTVAEAPNIMALVDAASVLIDEVTGRIDGDGSGSLVYSTCLERLLLQSPNRNVLRVSFKPMAVVSPSVVGNLQSLGSSGGVVNSYYTGVQTNTVVRPDGSVSAIISASGRYGYPRRGQQALYPDINYMMNPLMMASWFGGPPAWVGMDASAIDFDPKTGEIWVPAGLYLGQYSEIAITYNTGYDPLNMPNAVKQCAAAIVRNALARGSWTTGLRSLSGAGMVNVTFSDDLIDPTTDRMLRPYFNVIGL